MYNMCFENIHSRSRKFPDILPTKMYSYDVSLNLLSCKSLCIGSILYVITVRKQSDI